MRNVPQPYGHNCATLKRMENLRFTLFNAITLFMMALTALLVWRRFAGKLSANWPLGYYLLLVGYTVGFSGGLNPYWVACAPCKQ